MEYVPAPVKAVARIINYSAILCCNKQILAPTKGDLEYRCEEEDQRRFDIGSHRMSFNAFFFYFCTLTNVGSGPK